MSMQELVEQYKQQRVEIKRRIREMEKTNTVSENHQKYRQLKQMNEELKSSIRQMKKYQ